MNTLGATVLVQSSSSLLRMIILTISQSSLNMGEVGSKTRLVDQILEKPCKHLRGHSFGSIFIKLAQNEARVLVQSSSNLLRMIILTISQSSSNMGDLWSKTRSKGQIMEKPCEHSRGHSFGPIFIKLGQD